MFNFIPHNMLAVSVFGFTLVCAGSSLKIDKFEHNHLITMDSDVSKIKMAYENKEKLNLEKNDNFFYWDNKIKKSKKIINILEINDGIELWVQNQGQEVKNITPILYFLERKNFWENLFF